MIELRINVAESLVQSFGQASLERQVENFLQQLLLKRAADDLIEDLAKNDDLKNDAKWQVAREEAWSVAKDFYLPKPSDAK